MIYNILDCGAVPDGKTNCAPVIQAAVDAAHAAGGGVVLLPAGRYFSGSVLLKSNVELRLETGEFDTHHYEEKLIKTDEYFRQKYVAFRKEYAL